MYPYIGYVLFCVFGRSGGGEVKDEEIVVEGKEIDNEVQGKMRNSGRVYSG